MDSKLNPSVHTSALLEEYGPSAESWWLLGSAVLLAGMAVAAVLNVLAGDTAWSLLAALGLLFVANWLFRRFRRARERRAQIRENGLIVHDRASRIEIRWDEIAAIHFGASQAIGGKMSGNPQIAAAIMSTSGATLTLDNTTQSIVGLLAAIRRRAAPIIAERINSQLAAGDEVDLIGLKLIPTGILHGGRLLLWRELDSAEVTPDGLIVYAKQSAKPWCALPTETVRNADAIQILGPRYRDSGMPGS